MYNQYQAIGRLIINLRNGRFLENEDAFIAELEEEFKGITLQLGYYWLEKLDGWEYNINFHRAEAERLRDLVPYEGGPSTAQARVFIHEQLTEQMRRLDILNGIN
ncbi:hypothetical protein [Pedobacter sp. MC2016-24]|uniref:hypothetical protein n=1 Tax=Pedobacter sp. MC2016-24 TaxID=2780090 RepID=UPI00188001DD|nr:hypothetical protein [Pedobacter sp. MC2016-24]MBE9599510.1 hypothetical protein [Pedobacter sp. MC2016-24]